MWFVPPLGNDANNRIHKLSGCNILKIEIPPVDKDEPSG
jgi:hypothetical protein